MTASVYKETAVDVIYLDFCKAFDMFPWTMDTYK